MRLICPARPVIALLIGLAACKGGADDGLDDTNPVEVRAPNLTCVAPERPPATGEVTLTRAFDGLGFRAPVWVGQAPGDDATFYVLEQAGRVQAIRDGETEATLIADLTDRVDDSSSELGLLGLAFHPEFVSNQQVFLSYTSKEGRTLYSNLSRFTMAGGEIVPESEELLLKLEQPYSNHNGGGIAFGPDGYLYFGLGDGGSAGDPLGAGQDTDTLLGKMLRIDVDGEAPYGIPADNPFADGVGGRPEVFAWGLRNPWRWSFDRATGELWAGDVGQNKVEEVDLIQLGGNYGWNTMEGSACFPSGDSCDKSGLILPLAEYTHTDGNKSIVGGFVYRGAAMPSLVGNFLYADTYSGRLWALSYDPTTGDPSPVVLMDDTGLSPVSFGESNAGELLIVDYGGGGLYWIEPAGEPVASTFPDKLSATGCVDPADASLPSSGSVRYEVNAPFWSDGAEKERWFAIPDDATISVDETTGRLELPIGSVIVKMFRVSGQPIETRLMVRHDDGGWAGYTYQWDADGKDATLLLSSARVDLAELGLNDQDWSYPSRAQCLGCHTEVAGRTLGLSLAQNNRDGQLERWAAIGLLAAAPAASTPLPDPHGDGAVDERARAYLEVNCAMCHQPGGPGLGGLDLRAEVGLAETGACDAEPTAGDLGVDEARIIAPGDPTRSVLPLRMGALDVNRMPAVGSNVVDAEGVALIEAWITSLSGCE
jgi:uncharacterized repeat protein (TIGR03806 family)